MGVVAGEVARWFWSDNGDLAAIFLREYLKVSTEPFLVSIVYRDAGIRQEGPCLFKGLPKTRVVERRFLRICGGMYGTRFGRFGEMLGSRRLRF
jgi:hypothetical protein